MLLIGALKPGKRKVVIVEFQVSFHKGGSRNIARLMDPLEILRPLDFSTAVGDVVVFLPASGTPHLPLMQSEAATLV
jgi:hypothetical protein